MMRTSMLALLLLATTACGSDPEFSFGPLTATASRLSEGCTNLDNLQLIALRAVIAKNGECRLEFDAATGQSSGACPEIQTGEITPLVLLYEVTGAGGVQANLIAMQTGYADLRPESLDASSEVSVVLNDPDALILDDAGLAGLEDSVLGATEPEEVTREFAARLAEVEALTLDADADGCSNHQELCDGDLFKVDVCPGT